MPVVERVLTLRLLAGVGTGMVVPVTASVGADKPLLFFAMISYTYCVLGFNPVSLKLVTLAATVFTNVQLVAVARRRSIRNADSSPELSDQVTCITSVARAVTTGSLGVVGRATAGTPESSTRDSSVSNSRATWDTRVWRERSEQNSLTVFFDRSDHMYSSPREPHPCGGNLLAASGRRYWYNSEPHRLACSRALSAPRRSETGLHGTMVRYSVSQCT